MAVVTPRRPPIRHMIQRVIRRLAQAWLRYQLARRVAAELRADQRRRRLAGPGGQAFHAVVQINLAPRSR